MIALEAFSAKEGDALLLHYKDDSGPRYAIIDGGPAGVFTDVVAPRLAELDSTNNGLRVEFVVVSAGGFSTVVGGVVCASAGAADAKKKSAPV